MAKNNHADCRNFTPIDVAKGICHANNDSISLLTAKPVRCLRLLLNVNAANAL